MHFAPERPIATSSAKNLARLPPVRSHWATRLPIRHPASARGAGSLPFQAAVQNGTRDLLTTISGTPSTGRTQVMDSSLAVPPDQPAFSAHQAVGRPESAASTSAWYR